MEQRGKEILVTGATGIQGGAVVRHLLKQGWSLRALCRKPTSPAAQALAAAGVRVMPGDLEDRRALEEATTGVYGVFALQNYWDGWPGKVLGHEGEVRQGIQLAEAAASAGVRHFVQSSAAGAAAATGVSHIESKWKIEQHIRALGLPATFLRPVFYMDNFNLLDWGFPQPVLEGRLELPLLADKQFQMICADDIGHFAALAFARPHDFIGIAFELSGDSLDMHEMAACFSRVMGRQVVFTGGPHLIEPIRAYSPELAVMFEWFNRHGFEGFLPGLRALHPQMTDFETFLRRTGWEGGHPPLAGGGEPLSVAAPC
jgi:uncharacterized protein YbjT (DUF2867 family)